MDLCFSEHFRDIMYENMWSFMNPDMIKHIFSQIKVKIRITYKSDVNDDDFRNKLFHKTICFKGNINEGHYVYVQNSKNVYGTYENDLLYNDSDDGVCHSIAMIFALLKLKKIMNFPIILNPVKISEFRHNYRTIVNFYIWLIKTGYWDNALKDNFYHDVTWVDKGKTTRETKTALKTLVKYLKKL